MKKILMILLFAICSQQSYSQKIMVNGHRFSAVPPVTKQRIYIDFSLTNQSSGLGSKWNSLYGAPHSSVLTISNLTDTAGASTGVGITTVATANWSAYSGSTSSTDNFSNVGIGTYYPVTQPTHNIYTSNFYNSSTGAGYDALKPQFRLTGLNPAKTYSVYITNAELVGAFEAKATFRAVGLTSPAAIDVDGDVAFQSLGATFTIQPKVDGTIDIWANRKASGSPTPDIVCIPSIVIVEQ